LVLKKRLKIAVLATVTDFGGAERVVLSQIERIQNDQFDLVPIIFTVTRFTDNLFFKQLDRAGKKYYKVYVNNYKVKYLNPVANIFETYRLLKKNKFDLIHTHGYRADVLGIFLARILGLPAISTCHGFISNDLQLTLYNRLDRFILRFARKIIVVSEAIRSSLIKSGITESSISLIQNAVNGSYSVESFTENRKAKREYCGITEDDFVVGYVGRLSEEKGISYLIEAMSLLNKTGMPSKLLIIGEGPQRQELADLVKKTNIEENVIFTGFQNDIEYWLPSMDVFVLPSLTEGTPMSLLEAMAYGIPAVASAVGGVPQVIESGKSGILVPPGNPQDIKDAILLLYSNEELRNSLSKEGQKKIKLKYNIEDWTRQIEAEYLNLEN
jgi:glycosyltransferase involved in cell wall biosynthesis